MVDFNLACLSSRGRLSPRFRESYVEGPPGPDKWRLVGYSWRFLDLRLQFVKGASAPVGSLSEVLVMLVQAAVSVIRAGCFGFNPKSVNTWGRSAGEEREKLLSVDVFGKACYVLRIFVSRTRTKNITWYYAGQEGRILHFSYAPFPPDNGSPNQL